MKHLGIDNFPQILKFKSMLVCGRYYESFEIKWCPGVLEFVCNVKPFTCKNSFFFKSKTKYYKNIAWSIIRDRKWNYLASFVLLFMSLNFNNGFHVE